MWGRGGRREGGHVDGELCDDSAEIGGHEIVVVAGRGCVRGIAVGAGGLGWVVGGVKRAPGEIDIKIAV